MALFKKGDPGGPGRKPGAVNLMKRIDQCAKFMEDEGWKIAMSIARQEGKNSVAALTLLANYGYGKPLESIDVTSKGEAFSLADYLTKSFEMPHPSQLPPTQPLTPQPKNMRQ